MRGLGRILVRYIFSAAAVGFVLLALNAAALLVLVRQIYETEPQDQYHFSEYAASLTSAPTGYTLPEPMLSALRARYEWAMLLSDEGGVLWQDRLPAPLHRRYTTSDVASFTRWYLDDYPVYVYRHADGLLVLALPRGTQWKHSVAGSMDTVERALGWLPIALLLNLAAAALTALFFGWRFFRAARPLADGIAALAGGQPIQLPEHGALGSIAGNLNRASRTLQEQQALLKKRDRTRAEWIAGVSHDIRTPLALIQGYAGQLETDAGCPPPAREKAGGICAQSQRIGNLIRDLNLASRLEYSLQPIRWSMIRLPELLRQAAAEALNADPESRLNIEILLPPDPGDLALSGDESLLSRALSNLLGNSLRHNRGDVTVCLSLEASGSGFRVTVADNGVGYPEEVLDRLRSPLPEALPTKGLGLLLVRQIARAHGGHALFGCSGHGAVCTLELPAGGEAGVPHSTYE